MIDAIERETRRRTALAQQTSTLSAVVGLLCNLVDPAAAPFRPGDADEFDLQFHQVINAIDSFNDEVPVSILDANRILDALNSIENRWAALAKEHHSPLARLRQRVLRAMNPDDPENRKKTELILSEAARVSDRHKVSVLAKIHMRYATEQLERCAKTELSNADATAIDHWHAQLSRATNTLFKLPTDLEIETNEAAIMCGHIKTIAHKSASVTAPHCGDLLKALSWINTCSNSDLLLGPDRIVSPN